MTKPQTIRNLMRDSTQTEFAKKHGVTQQRVSEWLRGVRNISNSNLEAMAKKEGYALDINYKIIKL